MISLGEAALIVLLCLVVRWVAVKENAFLIFRTDQLFKVHIFNEYILQSLRTLSELREEFFQIDRLGGDRFPSAVKAVPLALVKGSGAINVGMGTALELQAFDKLRSFRLEDSVGNHQLFGQEIFQRLISVAEAAKVGKTIAGMEGQEAEFRHQREWTIPQNTHIWLYLTMVRYIWRICVLRHALR